MSGRKNVSMELQRDVTGKELKEAVQRVAEKMCLQFRTGIGCFGVSSSRREQSLTVYDGFFNGYIWDGYTYRMLYINFSSWRRLYFYENVPYDKSLQEKTLAEFKTLLLQELELNP